MDTCSRYEGPAARRLRRCAAFTGGLLTAFLWLCAWAAPVKASSFQETTSISDSQLEWAAGLAEEAICGDGVMEGSESCDDGNNHGGDGCAANCTFEDEILLDLGASAAQSQSSATIQTISFPISLPLTGQVLLTHGWPRAERSVGADGRTNFGRGTWEARGGWGGAIAPSRCGNA